MREGHRPDSALRRRGVGGAAWRGLARCVVGVVGLMLTSGRAAAAPVSATTTTATTAEAGSRCLAVAGLVGLAPDQQREMQTLCSRRGRPQPEHAPLLARLAARASWEASALAELVSGGAPHVDIGGEAATTARLLAARRALAGLDAKRLASPGCKPLATAIDAYVADVAERERPVPPFAAATVGDGRCVPLAAEGLADLHLLTIPAEPGQSLFVAAAAGERAVLQWFTAEEAVVRGERRLFVVAVPAWSV